MSEKMNEEMMPLELQLDLLVDEELPEERRAAVLREMERAPGTWRKLAVRFLERQAERKAARQLIDGGSLVLREPEAGVYKFPGAMGRFLTRGRMLAVAASLLVGAASASITWYVAGRGEAGPVAGGAAGTAVATVSLPGKALGMDKEMSVEVPVVKSQNESTGDSLFMWTPLEDANAPARRSLVIQPDGNGQAIVVPVNTMTNVSWR